MLVSSNSSCHDGLWGCGCIIVVLDNVKSLVVAMLLLAPCPLVLCRYYPKLQVCVPFTPVTGNRLLVQPGPLAPTVLKALAQTLVTITGKLLGPTCRARLVCVGKCSVGGTQATLVELCRS
jgi:hypothetical protein